MVQLSKPTELLPDLFKDIGKNQRLSLVRLSSAMPDLKPLQRFITATQSSPAVGISVTLSKTGALKVLALALSDQVIEICMDGQVNGRKAAKDVRRTFRDTLHEKILANVTLDKIGFDMEVIATALFRDHCLHLSSAVDAQTLYSNAKSRTSEAVLLGALGGETILQKDNVLRTLRGNDGADKDTHVALRAWAAFMVSVVPLYDTLRPQASPIHTTRLSKEVRSPYIRRAPVINADRLMKETLVLAKFVRDGYRLKLLKPNKMKNDVNSKVKVDENGNVLIELERYKTRIRRSDNQVHTISRCPLYSLMPIFLRGY